MVSYGSLPFPIRNPRIPSFPQERQTFGMMNHWLIPLIRSYFWGAEGWHLGSFFPSKIEWDLTDGPLGKLLELLDTQV